MPSRPTTPFNIKASYRFGYPPYTLAINPPYDRQMERVYCAEGRWTKGQCERISLPSSSADIALLCLLPSSADAMLCVSYNNALRIGAGSAQNYIGHHKGQRQARHDRALLHVPLRGGRRPGGLGASTRCASAGRGDRGNRLPADVL